MLAIPFGTIADSLFGIEITNPALITRVRRQAETITPHEIAASLAQAITDAADTAHMLAFDQAQFGEGTANAIVDADYHDDLAAAWSLVAYEHELFEIDALFVTH